MRSRLANTTAGVRRREEETTTTQRARGGRQCHVSSSARHQRAWSYYTHLSIALGEPARAPASESRGPMLLQYVCSLLAGFDVLRDATSPHRSSASPCDEHFTHSGAHIGHSRGTGVVAITAVAARMDQLQVVSIGCSAINGTKVDRFLVFRLPAGEAEAPAAGPGSTVASPPCSITYAPGVPLEEQPLEVSIVTDSDGERVAQRLAAPPTRAQTQVCGSLADSWTTRSPALSGTMLTSKDCSSSGTPGA